MFGFTFIYNFQFDLQFFSRELRKQIHMKKVVACIDIDDIETWRFIDEKWRNLKVVLGGGELTWNINQKKTSGVLQTNRSSLSGKCCGRGYFFNKQVECCESAR